jgi:hypothetical protein
MSKTIFLGRNGKNQQRGRSGGNNKTLAGAKEQNDIILEGKREYPAWPMIVSIGGQRRFLGRKMRIASIAEERAKRAKDPC